MGNEGMRKIFMWVIVIIAVVSIGFGILSKSITPRRDGEPTSGTGFATRQPAPATVVVPDKETEVPAYVAKPKSVSPAALGVEAKLRIFEITATATVFTPDTVVVNQGDVVRIKVTALDGDYDLDQPDYGFSQSIRNGEVKPLEFQASAAGVFKFFCPSCGGPTKGPLGSLIVVPKK